MACGVRAAEAAWVTNPQRLTAIHREGNAVVNKLAPRARPGLLAPCVLFVGAESVAAHRTVAARAPRDASSTLAASEHGCPDYATLAAGGVLFEAALRFCMTLEVAPASALTAAAARAL